MKKLLKSEIYGSYEQCTGLTDVLKGQILYSWNACKKKKKSKTHKREVFVSAFTFAHFTPFFVACVSGANNTVTAITHALFMNNIRNIWLFNTSVDLVYYSRDPQISLFNNFFIKNGFQFQQNKFHLNEPLIFKTSNNTWRIFFSKAFWTL